MIKASFSRSSRACQQPTRSRRALLSGDRVLLSSIILLAASFCLSADCRAATGRLIEVADDTQRYVGRVISMEGDTCCLVDRFGRIEHLSVPKLKSFRVVSERYRAASSSEVREQLRQEFPGYDVSGTAHYLVCGPRGRSQAYAALLEDTYRQIEQFYRARGFRTTTPEVVMVAVVFRTQQEFADYCRRDDVPVAEDLRGYYSLRSNRVALFETPRRPVRTLAGEEETAELEEEQSLTGLPGEPDRDTTDTMAHEGTHQVGYNIGIHSRVTSTPTWVLEGLATVLEVPGARAPSGFAPSESRFNQQRLRWFREQYATRRQAGDVARLVASEEPFEREPLDAYSEAWALTFFMSESPARTQQFVRYLRAVEGRDTSGTYTSQDRLRDFQEAFGDIARLEVDFLRFMDSLE
jgi:hypothetical protein